jgi:predicted CoA-binding protein
MTNLNQKPEAIRELLEKAQTIAVVGHSDNPNRTSYRIAQFLRGVGYTVYPVNPTITEIDGQPCYASLADVPDHIDIVNVFRRAEFLQDVVQEAIQVKAGAVWGQLDVDDPFAVKAAEAAKLPIVTDQCIKVEFGRLGITLPRK